MVTSKTSVFFLNYCNTHKFYIPEQKTIPLRKSSSISLYLKLCENFFSCLTTFSKISARKRLPKILGGLSQGQNPLKMGNYTILQMFENPGRGRQARNFTPTAPKILDLKSSSEQIFFRKLPLGALVSFSVYWWFSDETISKSANKILEIKSRISNEFKFFNCKMCLVLQDN